MIDNFRYGYWLYTLCIVQVKNVIIPNADGFLKNFYCDRVYNYVVV